MRQAAACAHSLSLDRRVGAAVYGMPGKTGTGELSLVSGRMQLLAPCLPHLPQSLTDTVRAGALAASRSPLTHLRARTRATGTGTWTCW